MVYGFNMFNSKESLDSQKLEVPRNLYSTVSLGTG